MTEYADFTALHHDPGKPLLLPNAWDHTSAALLRDAGFPAAATTSLGVAAADGLPDGSGLAKPVTLRVVRVLARISGLLFSVDAEDGYSDDPDQVAEFACELAEAGAVGLNLEDARPDGTLTDPEVHAAKIAAVKAAAPELFVNARTDTFWRGTRQDETEARLAAYRDAGADGVFVPGLVNPDAILALTKAIDLPLNVLYKPGGLTIAELAELGVRRVSLGSLLYRVALDAALTTAVSIRDNKPAGMKALSYDEIQNLSTEVDTGTEG